MQLREKKDEAATRERFWDVTQSKIGQLTGTTTQEQADAAAATDEANKLSVKFGGTVVTEEGTAHSPPPSPSTGPTLPYLLPVPR